MSQGMGKTEGGNRQKPFVLRSTTRKRDGTKKVVRSNLVARRAHGEESLGEFLGEQKNWGKNIPTNPTKDQDKFVGEEKG